MKVDFLSQAGKLLKEQKQYRRRLIVFLCLAVVVVYGTLTALKLYGQAMTHKMEVLDCQYKVHEHTDECYEMDEEGNLGTEPVCGYADYVIHVHNDDCYDADGNLTCRLEEHPAHEHTEECCVTEMVLVCGEEEREDTEAGTESPADASEGSADAESSAADEASAEVPDSEESVPEASEPQEAEIICGMEEHVHDDSCMGQALVCTQEGHEHTVECVDGDGNVICGIEEHVHDGNCQDAEGNIICGQEEHRHIIVCYDEGGNEICGKAVHTHDDSCRDAEGNIICGLEEHEHIVRCYQEGYICGTEEHTHTEACFAQEEAEGESAGAAEPEESTAPAEQESSAESTESSEAGTESSVETAGHVHTDECYEEVKTLLCGEQELHTHDDSCYDEECFDEDGNLIDGSRPSCGLLRLEEHVHTKECFKTVELTPEEVAALENGAKLHIHTEECYDEEGNLICGHDATHIHQPGCYDDAGKMICGYGAAVHVHEDKCYDEEGNLICGYETATHLHEESCYDADGNLQCGYETASHVHGKECCDEEGNLICGYEAAAHVHEDSCYDAEGNLICGYGTIFDTEDTVKLEGTFTYEAEDYALEIHVETDIPSESAESDAPVESMTDEESAGTDAGTEEKAESSSEPQASGTEPTEAESQPVTDDSAEEPGQEADASGIEELSEVHEGDTDTAVPETEESQDGGGDVPEETDSEEAEGQPEQDAWILLADENSGLTLKMIPLAAETEIHTEMVSYVGGIDGSKLLDLSVMELHVYRDGKEIDISDCAVAVNITPKAVTTEEMIEAYGEEDAAEEGNGIIVSALQETADGIQGSGNVFLTPDMAEVPVLQNAVAENGVLAIARYVNNETLTRTFQGESFIVTAAYRSYANIPAEAELIAELITEESDSEHYAKRQAEYQEVLGDETATMRALMKIGFYVEDENGEFTQEVEPENSVTITIQFLDENGLAEGKPITVIHFAEEGTELLEGSKVQDGSTTFEMGSFSEIAVGYGVENVKVPVNEELKYEADEFEVTFRIEGEVNVPVGGMRPEKDADPERESDAPGDSQEGESVGDDTENDAAANDSEAEADNADIPEGSGSKEGEGSGEAEDSGDTQADSVISEDDISVFIENSDLDKNLEFRVAPLDEEAEEYAKAAAAVYAEGTDGADTLDDQLFLQVLSYKLMYDGKKLDLSDCTVTAEVKPSEALVEYAETAVDPMTLDLDGEEQVAEDLEVKPEVVITAVELAEDGAESEIADAMVVGYEAMETPMLLTLSNEDGIVAFSGTSQANPHFTVEFYAWIDVLATPEADDKETIQVIDTAKRDKDSGEQLSDGSGGILPTNADAKARTIPRKSIKVAKGDGTVVMEQKLTEVYSSGSYDYISAPGLTYFNKIAKNDSYVLKEIQVLRQKGEAWETYSAENNKTWHFTNKQKTKDDYPDDFILITTGATIRLVHTVKSDTVRNGVHFYDYDISDGNLYSNETKYVPNKNDPSKPFPSTVARGENTTHNSGAEWFMYTNRQGINSMPGQTFGFGNSEGTMRTGLGSIPGNQAVEDHILYGKATFGLVTGMEDGKLIYADGVKAPNLFNEGNATGKTPYVGNLVFSQKGDTFTLTGAEVKEGDKITSSVGGLDKFKRQMYSWAASSSPNYKTYWFAGNDFYPLDNVSSAGTIGHDLKFGADNCAVLKNFGGYDIAGRGWTENAPKSDDGQNHNHYFGMHYTVNFHLVKDYVGPLEYLFYGDDDMWVFLDGPEPENRGRLICDIGGVHSSVGEYVNLWDYIKKGSEGDYTLTFYYTERGASGSTCWMQFTLPSVTFATTEQDTGELKIQKKVNGSTDERADEEFGFEIKFTDSHGNDLMDDYSYTKFDKNNNVINNDVLIWNNAKFTLKAGEYIVVKFLPHGSKYTITEVGPVTVTSREPGGGLEWTEKGNNPYTPETSGGNSSGSGVVRGSIEKDSQVEIEYNNVLKFALPETGGPGAIPYTIAGGIIVLLGAGFLYKKKFRERRA